MSDNTEKKDGGLSADELLAILTGKCLHEVQLGRITGLLGLVALQAGGSVELRLDGLKELDGRGIAIAIDERAGTATVRLTDNGLGDEVTPTHDAPSALQ